MQRVCESLGGMWGRRWHSSILITERVKEYAEEIGESAIAVKCNCLNKEEIKQAKKEINEKFGRVNFLINGAGGNNAKATCDNEYMTRETEGIKDFFALEESGLKSCSI